MPSSTPRPTASRGCSARRGLVPGDHVAWCLENHRNFLSLAWGAYYAGLIYTPISSRLTTDEIAYIVDNSGAQAFVTSRYKSAQARSWSTGCRRSV